MGVATDIYPALDRGSDQSERGKVRKLGRTELEKMYRYAALLGVPPWRDLNDPVTRHGQDLFQQAKCAGCHAPFMTTSPYHPLAELRGQTIRPYTDMLLHDVGPGLADNMSDGTAPARDWRTAPLWDIG